MKERFDVYRHEDEEVIVTTGALNGFAEASQLQRKGPSAFSYSLDGTNYNPEIYIPDEGAFMILPTDILENIHFYLSFRYSRTGRLSNFSFSYRHFNDVKGNFVGEKYEIGSEAVLKDLTFFNGYNIFFFKHFLI